MSTSSLVLYVQKQLLETVLSSVFIGLFTVLVGAAARILLSRRQNKGIGALLIFAIVFMYTSAAIYWVTIVYNAFSTSAEFDKRGQPTIIEQADDGSTNKSQAVQDCVGMSTLFTNVTIGDSIIWWRVGVLWRNSRVIGSVIIASTLALLTTATVHTAQICSNPGTSSSVHGFLPAPTDDYVQVALGHFPSSECIWIIITMSVSLVINMLSTYLIGYRAWKHRRLVKSYLRRGTRRTQVEKVLALLTESGLFYCVILCFCVVYQASRYGKLPEASAVGLAEAHTYLVEGLMVILVGMYPTIIVILCALDQSHHDADSLQNMETLFDPSALDGDGSRGNDVEEPKMLFRVSDVTLESSEIMMDETSGR